MAPIDINSNTEPSANLEGDARCGFWQIWVIQGGAREEAIPIGLLGDKRGARASATGPLARSRRVSVAFMRVILCVACIEPTAYASKMRPLFWGTPPTFKSNVQQLPEEQPGDTECSMFEPQTPKTTHTQDWNRYHAIYHYCCTVETRFCFRAIARLSDSKNDM